MLNALVLKLVGLIQVTKMGKKMLHLKICFISFVEKH